jgi:hypothetical protein
MSRWTLGPNYPDHTDRPPATTYRLNGRWSRAHDRCIDCGTTERHHGGQGRCWQCRYRHRKNLPPAGHIRCEREGCERTFAPVLPGERHCSFACADQHAQQEVA